jgi:NAD(P)-dependent dehydrogenase (short-subunit alcohol dehydrogenase family)
MRSVLVTGPAVRRGTMAPLAGLTFLVTGATGGIGRAFVESLAGTGARVIAHGRSAQRLDETVRVLAARGVEATGLIADLASLDETARLAGQALALGRPIDVLINNAGVGFGRDRTLRETSRDGFELRLAVNYLAPVLLTRKLLAGGMPTRVVVNVASAGQEALDLEDLQSTRHYDGVQAYRRSKLALICFTFDLAEESKVAVNALHPGTFLDSGMVRESGIHPLGPVSRGAETIRHVVEQSLEGVTGRYFDELKPARPDPQANDHPFRKKLSERIHAMLRRWDVDARVP